MKLMKKAKRTLAAILAAAMAVTLTPNLQNVLPSLSDNGFFEEASADFDFTTVKNSFVEANSTNGEPFALFEKNGTPLVLNKTELGQDENQIHTINLAWAGQTGDDRPYSDYFKVNNGCRDYLTRSYKLAVIADKEVELKPLVNKRIRETPDQIYALVKDRNGKNTLKSEDDLAQNETFVNLAADTGSGSSVYYFSYDNIINLLKTADYANSNNSEDSLSHAEIVAKSADTNIYGIYAVRVQEVFNFNKVKNDFIYNNSKYGAPITFFEKADDEGALTRASMDFDGKYNGEYKNYFTVYDFNDFLKDNYKFAVISDAFKADGNPQLSIRIWRRSDNKHYHLKKDGSLFKDDDWSDANYRDIKRIDGYVRPETGNYVSYYNYNEIIGLLKTCDDYDPHYDCIDNAEFKANNGETRFYGIYAVKIAPASSEAPTLSDDEFSAAKASITNSSGQATGNETVTFWEKNAGFCIPFYGLDHMQTNIVRHFEFSAHDAYTYDTSYPDNKKVWEEGSYISPNYEIAVMLSANQDPVLELYMDHDVEGTTGQTLHKRYWNGGRDALDDPNADFHVTDGTKVDCYGVDYSRYDAEHKIYYWTFEDIINALDEYDRAAYEADGETHIDGFGIGVRNHKVTPDLCFYGIYAVPEKIKGEFNWSNINTDGWKEILKKDNGEKLGNYDWFAVKSDDGGNLDNAKGNITKIALVADTLLPPKLGFGTKKEGRVFNEENERDLGYILYPQSYNASDGASCKSEDGYVYYYDYSDLVAMLKKANDTVTYETKTRDENVTWESYVKDTGTLNEDDSMNNIADIFIMGVGAETTFYGIYAITEEAELNTPVVSGSSVTWTVDGTAISVDKTGVQAQDKSVTVSGEANATIGDVATITVASGGTLKLDPNVDSVIALTLTGEGSKFKLGTNDEITLASGQTATVSADGIYASVDDGTKTTYYQKNCGAYVEIQKTAMPEGFDVKAISFVDDLEYSYENLKTLKIGLTLESRIPKTDLQLMNLKAIGFDTQGRKIEKKHLTFKGNVKVHMPFGKGIHKLTQLLFKYINDLTYKFEEVTADVHDNFFEYNTNHFSSWLLTDETPGHNVTVDSNEKGTVKVRPEKPKAGNTVTLTVTPAEGYELGTLTVNDGAVTVSSNTFTMPDKDVTVAATFTPITYSIEYTLDGGALASGESNPTAYTIETDTITLINPTKTGYEFAGWSGTELSGTNNKSVSFSGKTGNRKYTANWTAYTITFTAQSDETLTGQESGEAISTVNGLLASENIPTIAKTGKVFNGWYEDNNNEPFDFTKKINKNVTLSAKWAAAATVAEDVKATASPAVTDKIGGKEIAAVGGEPATTSTSVAITNAAGTTIAVSDIKIVVATVPVANADKIDSDLSKLVKDKEKSENLPTNKEFDYTPLKSMDISLTDKDGNAINDDYIPMWITVKFGDGVDLLEYKKPDCMIVIMHIPDDQTKEPTLISGEDVVILDSKTLKFLAPGFSCFTIAAIQKKDKTTSGGSHSVDYDTEEKGSITFHVYDSYAEAAECSQSVKEAVIPDKVSGVPVTAIAENAFNSCKSLKTVTLPDSVKEIRASAFWGCTSLESIIIPASVTSIDKDAFKKCTSLKEIQGYKGSYAETFAKANGYDFKALEPAETTAVSSSETETTTTSATTVSTVSTAETSAATTAATTLKLGTVNDPTVGNDGKISWTAAENASQYRVVKIVGSKKYYGAKVPHTYYYFDNIPNEDYSVFVYAVSSDGRFTKGKTLNVKVKAVGSIEAPTVDKDGTVSWKAAENAVKYKVVKIVNGVYYGGKETSETSYKFKSVPVSDYQVYVAAYGENGAKTVSDKTAVKVAKPLGFVNNVKVSEDGKVTWSKAQNAKSYRVVKVISGKKFYGKETKTTSYQFEKAANKDYQVYVVAYGANKALTAGKPVTVKVGDLGAVLDLKVDKNGRVTWTAARNAVKYKVYKVINGRKFYGITDKTSYTFEAVPSKTYKVYVVSFDKNGKYRVGTVKTVKK